MTNPKNDPTPKTESIDQTKRGATQHETGKPNSPGAEGQSQKVNEAERQGR